MTIRPALLAATAAVAVVSLAACGGSSSNTATGGSQPTGQASSQASGSGTGQGAGGFAGRNPGTSGKIAAISGKTLQVQNQTDGQVAVSYTAKTAITAQVAASLADVKVGSCVTVTPVMSASGAPSAKSGASSTGPLAAGNVRISQPTNGSCLGGLGTMRPGGAGGAGGAGGSASGFPSGRPSGFPTKLPSGFGSGGPGGGRSFAFGANGKVTAVSATGFTVASQFPGASSQAPRDTTVTVSGSTTYTTTKPGTAAALKVGKCVTATGASDDTGAVTADRLVVSDPVDGACTGGFMIHRGAAGGTGQGGTGTSDGGAA
jgi:hypothetical protein